MQKSSVKIPFHNVLTFTLAAGISNLAISPATLSARVAAIAETFNLYRIDRFKYRLVPYTLASEVVVAGYVSDTVDGTLSFTSVAESNALVTFGLQMSVPSDWMNVPSQVLRGALPWYKAVAGTPTTWEEQAGTLNFASINTGSTATLCLEFDGTIEFNSPIDPTLTPAMRKVAQDKREKLRILKLLAEPEKFGTGSKTKP